MDFTVEHLVRADAYGVGSRLAGTNVEMCGIKPPSLKTMVISTAPSDPFVEFPTCGIPLTMLVWYSITGNRELPPGLGEVDWAKVFHHLPVGNGG